MSIPTSAMMPKDTDMERQRDYWVAWLATFLFFVAFYALIVPLPRYLTGIGLPDWQVGLVLGATGIASLLTRPISGILTDRFGYRRMLRLGSISLLVGAVGVVFTSKVTLLFLLRILQALGYVIFTTAGNALVGELTSPEERSRKIAYFGLAANFAISMTPGITEAIVSWIGLKMTFWLTGGFAICSGLLTQKLQVRRQEDLSTSTASVVLWDFWRFPRKLWSSMFVTALFGLGFGAYFQFFAVLLERRAIFAAPVFASYGISIILTRLFLGHHLDRMGVRRVLLAAALIMAIGLLLAAFAYSLPLLMAAAALIAAGGGLFHPMLIAYHVSQLPARPGWAVACFYFGFDAGVGLGAWLLGVVLDLAGLSVLYIVAAILTVATIFFIPHLKESAYLTSIVNRQS